jgi:hypothetical protein
MAYLRALKVICRRCSSRPATQQLVTTYNEVFGDYCTPCSKVMLKQLQDDEAKRAAER